MTTPEGKVKNEVKKTLKKYKAYYHMPVQNGMGSPTLDFIGCHEGRFFAVETKSLGKKPTLRQQATIIEMQKAKGPAFVVDGIESLAVLEEWLKREM